MRGSRGRQDDIEYTIVCVGFVSAAVILPPTKVDGTLPSGTAIELVGVANVGAAFVSIMFIVTGQYGKLDKPTQVPSPKAALQSVTLNESVYELTAFAFSVFRVVKTPVLLSSANVAVESIIKNWKGTP